MTKEIEKNIFQQEKNIYIKKGGKTFPFSSLPYYTINIYYLI